MEIESALVAHPRIAEAAVVGRPHEIKGEAVSAFVVCRGARPGVEAAALARELREWVGEQLGAIAKPDDIRFADNLPKTRSGKIMRRLLRAVARGEAITEDISTLENPAIIEQLRGPPAGATALKAAKVTPVPGAPVVKAAPAKRPVVAKAKTKIKAKAKANAKTEVKVPVKRKAAVKAPVRAAARTKMTSRTKSKARTAVRSKAKSRSKARPARGK
jgi:hypothetical protein